MTRTWADVRVDLHHSLLNALGGVRHPLAGYVEYACPADFPHALLSTGATCSFCRASL